MLKLMFNNKMLIITCVLLLAFVLLDCRKDTEVNDFNKLINFDPHIVSNSNCIFIGTKDKTRYEAIQNSINILKETNPIIAEWVENKWKNKQLIFTEDGNNYYAKFDFINGNLYVNKSVFAENDGVVAITFAHEYRHSRQSYTKFVKSVISRIINKIGNDEILENDAIAYEQKAYNAIFDYYDE